MEVQPQDEVSVQPASETVSSSTSSVESRVTTSIVDLQTRLQHSFSKLDLLEQALTHKSFANEAAGTASPASGDNERLEFLGDAVLDLAVSALLMARFPKVSEGGLSKKRASLVNEETLSITARELGLDSLIRLGKGEIKTGGLQKPRILASTFEAVIGAIFLDAGYDQASNAIEVLFSTRLLEIESSNVDFQLDYKTRLQERIQEIYKATPTYKVHAESGPDHDKQFEVSVNVLDKSLGLGLGRSKKAAEQDAAKKALESLSAVSAVGSGSENGVESGN